MSFLTNYFNVIRSYNLFIKALVLSTTNNSQISLLIFRLKSFITWELFVVNKKNMMPMI